MQVIDIYQGRQEYVSMVNIAYSSFGVNTITIRSCKLLSEIINQILIIMKTIFKVISMFTIAGFFLASCEGPMGPAGKDGVDGAAGANGKDANETCKECHSPTVVDAVAVQFEFSKHSFGEAAFEEAGNTGCTPCHTSEAFKYVVKNNVPSTFTLNATTGKYANDYATVATSALGEITCFTCHSSLHTTYAGTDFSPLTTTAAVSMTMWKGAKSINLTQDGGMSNLCVKCHQPRPLTTSTTLSNGDVVNYADLVANPTAIFYDSSVGNATPNKLVPSYRTHVHYGPVGAVFAGVGGIEFAGTQTYANSTHTTAASCQDCHMATIANRSGGHTFAATGNFNNCNMTGCHSAPINGSSSAFWTGPRNEIKALLSSVATKINSVGSGPSILHKDATTANLWLGKTAENYDGYLDIFDPSTNPLGAYRNPAPSSSWIQADKDKNAALPIFPTLKNVVMGSIVNFQMGLREYSLGIHNYKYSKALLQNSIDAMTAAGI
jgi:hypothetical protein